MQTQIFKKKKFVVFERVLVCVCSKSDKAIKRSIRVFNVKQSYKKHLFGGEKEKPFLSGNIHIHMHKIIMKRKYKIGWALFFCSFLMNFHIIELSSKYSYSFLFASFNSFEISLQKCMIFDFYFNRLWKPETDKTKNNIWILKIV